MNLIVEKSLDLWGLQDAAYILVAARENQVFKITTNTDQFALRLHRKNYRSDAELLSELKWMAAASAGGISVPSPIKSKLGNFLHSVDGIQVDILTWLDGQTLVELSEEQKTPALFHQLGIEMGRLHQVSDAWQIPKNFTRCSWDREGLLSEQPLWDRFWDNHKLSIDEKQLLLRLRTSANQILIDIEEKLDYGLIHADLVGNNVLVDQNKIRLIDFDDGGYGYRLFDITTALLKNRHCKNYSEIKSELLKGYMSVRDIDLTQLDLFMALRAATYVGWNITRMHEDGGDERNSRFIETACALVRDYLDADRS